MLWRSTEFSAQMFSLIDETWNSLERYIAKHFGDSPKINLIRSQAFAAVIHSRELPASIMVEDIFHTSWSHPLHDDIISELVGGEASSLRLYALCRAMHGVSKWKNNYPISELIMRSWESRLYHLQLEALELSKGASMADEPVRSEIAAFLSSLAPPRDIFLSTTLVEALHSFDLIEAVDADPNELTRALNNPHDPSCRNIAYSAVGQMFDELGDNYFEIVESLSKSDQLKLYAMAALSEGAEDGFHLGFCMQQVVKLSLSAPDDLTEEALRRWSAPPDLSKVFFQEPIVAFTAAVCGLARLGLDLRAPARAVTSDETAWMALAEIVYCAVVGIAGSNRSQDAWKRLSKGDCVKSAMLLSLLERQGRLFGTTNEQVPSISSGYPNDVRQLLENALSRGPSALLACEPKFLRDDFASFIFGVLGVIGNERTIEIIKPYVDVVEFGRAAMSAIGKIRRSSEA